ncbi:MAG: tRNA pseudouridine(54/55) synthase Pus10 [Candidatus Bipolaricaulota bacterium]
MEINEKQEKLLKENLCDRCLGRQFGDLGHGLENHERGMIVRKFDELTEEAFVRENVPDETPVEGECTLCNGLFCHLDEYVTRVEEKLGPYEFNTILIGSRIPGEIEENQRKIWNRYGDNYARSIKSELNRLIGRKVQSNLGVEADFERPDVNAILDLRENRVELQVNSALFYGQYNKYVRGIPQTIWHCKKCHGRGCEECDYTGKKYRESVQEIVQEPFVRETEAAGAKFHGAGREDVDVKCFGRREFVLELETPLRRNLDLTRIQRGINDTQGKVEVFELKATVKDKVEEIKEKRADKIYRALVKLSREVDKLPLKKIDTLQGTVRQTTPGRVSHRRADKVRKRDVYWVHREKICDKELELTVKTEAGTYIKELISGDEGRTEPNVADLLGCDASCRKLEVLDIS